MTENKSKNDKKGNNSSHDLCQQPSQNQSQSIMEYRNDSFGHLADISLSPSNGKGSTFVLPPRKMISHLIRLTKKLVTASPSHSFLSWC
mmetsp:Transcript_29810/g.88492  ORF Transcript_29810/g.88492 Transcript_29810/m.88492 type:complete len:89 (+) Transcript_29810:1630-1896(+)